METADRDMANAALLMNEKINERIREAMSAEAVGIALVSNPAVYNTIYGIVHSQVEEMLRQMAMRLQPVTYYGTTTGSAVMSPPGPKKNFW